MMVDLFNSFRTGGARIWPYLCRIGNGLENGKMIGKRGEAGAEEEENEKENGVEVDVNAHILVYPR
jgi:hypothetical protein